MELLFVLLKMLLWVAGIYILLTVIITGVLKLGVTLFSSEEDTSMVQRRAEAHISCMANEIRIKSEMADFRKQQREFVKAKAAIDKQLLAELNRCACKADPALTIAQDNAVAAAVKKYGIDDPILKAKIVRGVLNDSNRAK